MTEGKCPFRDFLGNQINEGDEIIHPSSERGRVVVLNEYENISDRWRVDYGDGILSRLCLQIGDKGKAIVVRQ